MGILMCFFLVIGILQRSMEVVVSSLTFMLIFLIMMIMINSLSVDTTTKWDIYALSLPLRRRDIVASKYVLFLTMSVAGGALILLITAVCGFFWDGISLTEQVAVIGAVIGATWLLIAIILPLIYKFGVEKARFFFIFIVLAPTLGVMLLKNLNIPQPQLPDPEQLVPLLWLIPVVLLLMLYCSYRISVAVFSRKDL